MIQEILSTIQITKQKLQLDTNYIPIWPAWHDNELPFTYEEWAKILNRNPSKEYNYKPHGFLIELYMRQDYIDKIGFALNTRQSTQALANHIFKNNHSAIEVGAGSGFLTNALNKLKPTNANFDHIEANELPLDKTSYSINQWRTKPFTNLIIGNAPDIIPNYDAIIMSWPDYSEKFAFKTTRAMKPASTLYYCGEGNGGCTGCEDFHKYLNHAFTPDEEATDKIDRYFGRFEGIHDHWVVYHKRETNG